MLFALDSLLQKAIECNICDAISTDSMNIDVWKSMSVNSNGYKNDTYVTNLKRCHASFKSFNINFSCWP